MLKSEDIKEILVGLTEQLRTQPEFVKNSLLDLLHTNVGLIDRINLINIKLLLADAHSKLGETRLAIDTVEDQYSQLLKTDPALLKARILHTNGTLHSSVDPTKAEQFLRHALELRQNHAAPLSDVSHTLDALGVVLSSLGQFNEAVDVLYQCREIRSTLGNLAWLAAANLHLASTLSEMQRYHDCLEYTQQALKLYTQANDQIGVSIANANMACALLEIGKATEAVEIFEALLNSPFFSRPSAKRFIQTNLACALSRVHREQEGLELFITAIGGRDISFSVNCSLAEVRSMTMLLFVCNYIPEALEWVEVGMDIVETNKHKSESVSFLELASEVYAAALLIDKAYQSLQRALELNSVLVQEERRVISLDSKLSANVILYGQLRSVYPTLAASEAQACVFFHEGHSTKDVARIMNCSVRTVDSIRLRASRKMGLPSSRELEAAINNVKNMPNT